MKKRALIYIIIAFIANLMITCTIDLANGNEIKIGTNIIISFTIPLIILGTYALITYIEENIK